MKTYLQRVKAAQWNGTTEEEAREFCEKFGLKFACLDVGKREISAFNEFSFEYEIKPTDYVTGYGNLALIYALGEFPKYFTPAEITRVEIDKANDDAYEIPSQWAMNDGWNGGFNAAIEFMAKKFNIEIKENGQC